MRPSGRLGWARSDKEQGQNRVLDQRAIAEGSWAWHWLAGVVQGRKSLMTMHPRHAGRPGSRTDGQLMPSETI